MKMNDEAKKTLKELYDLRSTYENHRMEIAKQIYTDIQVVIDRWCESHDDIAINCFWDGAVEVDGQVYDEFHV